MNLNLLFKELSGLKNEFKALRNLITSQENTEFTTLEAANFLKLSDSFLYKLPKDVLPYKKYGKLRIYLKEDLLTFKKQRENGTSHPPLDISNLSFPEFKNL